MKYTLTLSIICVAVAVGMGLRSCQLQIINLALQICKGLAKGWGCRLAKGVGLKLQVEELRGKRVEQIG